MTSFQEDKVLQVRVALRDYLASESAHHLGIWPEGVRYKATEPKLKRRRANVIPEVSNALPLRTGLGMRKVAMCFGVRLNASIISLKPSGSMRELREGGASESLGLLHQSWLWGAEA
jgi:hypothetical protein